MVQQSRLSTVLSGVAGEYFVAAELSRRGYIASITLRNTRGVDILASNADATKSVGIQVKTNQRSSKKWVLNNKVEESWEDTAANLFFVFVNLNDSGTPTFHVVPKRDVAAFTRSRHERWLNAPGRGGRPHVDTTMRHFLDPDDKYLGRWDLLGL